MFVLQRDSHCSRPMFALQRGLHCSRFRVRLTKRLHCSRPMFVLQRDSHCSRPMFALQRGLHCSRFRVRLTKRLHCSRPMFVLQRGLTLFKTNFCLIKRLSLFKTKCLSYKESYLMDHDRRSIQFIYIHSKNFLYRWPQIVFRRRVLSLDDETMKILYIWYNPVVALYMTTKWSSKEGFPL